MLLFGAAGVSAQSQSQQQQNCINKMNQTGTNVAFFQAKENRDCLTKYQRGQIGGAEACLPTDPKNRVARQEATVSKFYQKDCTGGTNVYPDFSLVGAPVDPGDTDSQIINAAKASQIAMMHAIFGSSGNLDAALYACDPNKDECKCQRDVLRVIEKTWFTYAKKMFSMCKKAQLKLGSTINIGEIEKCVTDAATDFSMASDEKAKLTRRWDQLDETLTNKCDFPGVGGEKVYNNSFDGTGAYCNAFADAENLGDANARTGLAGCLVDIAACTACEMYNSFDDMTVDCDTWVGVTCP
jgi:hypothetical protein